MIKIFGYSKKAGKDWFNTDVYSDKEIESIKDPEGGSEIRLPTAIPSPFARIDLVKTAFRNIAKSPNLKSYVKDGDVIAGVEDEKLVSDALDVAEIMFNIDMIKDKIRIIVWDRETEISTLKNSLYKGHRQLGDTLELYLTQDNISYNFDLLKRFYLIEYDHKIIGCTSPATLFFATANDLSHAQIKLTKNDVTFDNEYTPLYLRDAEFQKYLYLLFKANPILAERLPVITEYLESNLKILGKYNNELYREIKTLKETDFNVSYSELDTGISGDVVDVIGVVLRKRKKEDIVKSLESSDFVINSTKCNNKLKPLVLQNHLAKKFKYANDVWDNKINVPYIDHESVLERRKLPGINIQYPYLTVSDFLEPYLIRLVYPIDYEKFFNGNLSVESGDDSKGYILPLKKTFFDYFDVADLVYESVSGPKIEMVQGAVGSVKVILRIPIAKRGDYISFERTYYVSSDKPDEQNNKGVIVEHQLGVTIFPFIKTGISNIGAYYRVQLVDRDVVGYFKNADFDLKFFSNTDPSGVEVRAKKLRSRKKPNAAETATTQYYVLQDEFDFIQISNIGGSGATGIIIPKWQPFSQGNEVFSFAVDFGTTNTHIEYKIGNSAPQPFEISIDDIQIATLFHPSKTTEDFGGTGAIAIRELIVDEFVPPLIGKGSEYKFPHRTVISESHSLNVDAETFALADFNIPFMYERKYPKDRIHSNLKWTKKEIANEKRIRAFFEILLMLLRNKVLLNRGNLSQTKLVWFYPSSMKPGRRSQLESTWNELFDLYFKPVDRAVGITESLAPFYYFKGTNKLQGGSFRPVVSIDIGGGTTDVVVFKQNKPLLLTSFKFGANAIFGEGFSEYGAASSNGLVSKYFPYFENLLAQNNLHELTKVLFSMKERNRAEDINAFLFSIEKNSKIREKNTFSYNSLLSSDEDLKIIFIYFYSAIIYHIAELLKQMKIELPKHIVFSGTGSKVLNIITPDLKILSTLSRLIFENVYGEKYETDGLSVETEKEMPKEVTCKGGLMVNADDLAFDISSIKSVYTCLVGKESLTYGELTDIEKGNIVEHVSGFNKFFLKLNDQYCFSDYFTITARSFELFKDECNKHIRDYLEDGLEYNRKLDEIVADDRELEETLFFYPLIGVINNLTTQLSQLSNL